jgi:hypothetical protein
LPATQAASKAVPVIIHFITWFARSPQSESKFTSVFAPTGLKCWIYPVRWQLTHTAKSSIALFACIGKRGVLMCELACICTVSSLNLHRF